MKLLIDADFIVYKACAACETEIDWGDDVIMVISQFSQAYKAVKREIKKIENAFFSSTGTILFFSDSRNFRKLVLDEMPGCFSVFKFYRRTWLHFFKIFKNNIN